MVSNISGGLRQGLSYSKIARRVGLHRVTVSKWLALDAPPTVPEEIAPERAGLPPPPVPWQSWDEVREVGEALRTHRFLLLRRPEHLNEEQQAQVNSLLESPIGPQLQPVRSFLEAWYRLWCDEDGQRRTVEEARLRYNAWRSNETYRNEPVLRRVLDQMTAGHFERLSPFLRHPDWEVTNNGAERVGRAFRHQQAPHFNLRSGEAIEGAIVGVAFQKKAVATATPNLDAARSTRGRKAIKYDELAVAA